MKKAFIVIASGLLFTACKKGGSPTNDYQFNQNDSTASNVPIFNNPHAVMDSFKHGSITSDQKDFIIKENTYIDTVNKHDTIIVNYWVTTAQALD